jgi:hypothetical protein
MTSYYECIRNKCRSIAYINRKISARGFLWAISGEMIHAHPTLAEGMMEAAEDVHRMVIPVMKEK